MRLNYIVTNSPLDFQRGDTVFSYAFHCVSNWEPRKENEMNAAVYFKRTPHTSDGETVLRVKDGRVLGYLWPNKIDKSEWFARPFRGNTACYPARDLAVEALQTSKYAQSLR